MLNLAKVQSQYSKNRANKASEKCGGNQQSAKESPAAFEVQQWPSLNRIRAGDFGLQK
jgi:hypothetical protein